MSTTPRRHAGTAAAPYAAMLVVLGVVPVVLLVRSTLRHVQDLAG